MSARVTAALAVSTGVATRVGGIGAVNRITLPFKHRVGQVAGLARDGQGRGEVRDARYASGQVRDLEPVPTRDLEPVHVVESVPVSDEINALAIRTPDRVDVLAVVEDLEGLDLARRRVVNRELHRGERQAHEVCRGSTVRDERDFGAVRAPRGLEIGEAVVRDLPYRSGRELDGVHVRDAAADAGERDLRAVRAP